MSTCTYAQMGATIEGMLKGHAGIAVAAVVGLFALKFTLSALGAFYAHFVRSGKNLKKYGKWAVVTGATDGIGKAYAAQLARQGLNVLIISRTQSKLDEVQKEITEKSKVEVKTLAIDFSKFDEAARAKVQAALDEIKDIGVLINNVGLSYQFPMYFSELDNNDVTALVELNVNSTLWMTRLVLPFMEQKKKGAIVNISSGSSCVPCPLLAEYSAAKGFVNSFTRSMAKECAAKGIDIQVQFPMFVTTKLSKIRRPSFFTPTPAAYARVAARHIGYETSTSPYWPHALQIYVVGLFPEWVQNQIVWQQHAGLRSRGLKKAKQN